MTSSHRPISSSALAEDTKHQFHPKPWLAILGDHINLWQREDGASFRSAMWAVVETFRAQGWDAVLDMDFPVAGDIADQQRLAAQKLRRWLQQEHVPAGPNFLRELERVIVAAMPTTVRLSYLNEIYYHADVICIDAPHSNAATANLIQLAAIASKESGEGVSALLTMPRNPTDFEKRRARKELLEGLQAFQHALDALDGGSNDG